MSIRKSETAFMLPLKTPARCLSMQCPGIVGFHCFSRGVHFLASASAVSSWVWFSQVDVIAYLKNIKKRDDGIEYHIGPEQNVHSIMKDISTARHE